MTDLGENMIDDGDTSHSGATVGEETLPVDEEVTFDDDEGEAATEWKQLPPERDFFATPYAEVHDEVEARAVEAAIRKSGFKLVRHFSIHRRVERITELRHRPLEYPRSCS